MKVLLGKELADYIKERQARQVRTLRQAHGVFPKLAIVQTIDSPVIDSYVRMKQRYGTDILVDVEVYKVDQAQLLGVVSRLNSDDSVHGIIIQLPLENQDETEQAVNAVLPEKDVDGLGNGAVLDPATPLAVDWLLAGFNVELAGKKIAMVGNGRLVGVPLTKMWRARGYDVTVFDRKNSDEMSTQLREFDVVVTATGVPGLIRSTNIRVGAVVVDAGTASEHGKIVGDVGNDLRTRDDLTITPEKGGVGPLTVTALFDNTIRAAQKTVKQ